jgi:general nucleoside transport system permease protein
MSQVFSNAFLFAAVLQTTPLLLAALGGMFSQQASVLNIALDGMMLLGAFVSVSVGGATHNTALGVLAAMAASVVVALIFAVTTLYLGADVVVAGIGIGTLVAGLTVLLLSVLYGNEGYYLPQSPPVLWKIHLGFLSHVWILGPAFQGQSILVVVAVLLIPVSWWVLYRTRYGLRVRAVGEEESAAAAAGLSPRTIKLSTVLISGALCGLAGSQLALATLGQFTANMTAGRGYLALAAIFAGGARPVGTAVACLVFGLVSTLANQLQLVHYNTDIMLMLPYVATVLVLLARPLLRLARQRHQERTSAFVS